MNTTFEIEIDPAIAELIAEAERTIAYEQETRETAEAQRQAELDAFIAQRTEVLLDEIGDQIREAVRPYVRAADYPMYGHEQEPNWLPSNLWFEIPGVNAFHALLRWNGVRHS